MKKYGLRSRTLMVKVPRSFKKLQEVFFKFLHMIHEIISNIYFNLINKIVLNYFRFFAITNRYCVKLKYYSSRFCYNN